MAAQLTEKDLLRFRIPGSMLYIYIVLTLY
jgi:hypothetical protein